jgi:hypothetical protein
MLRFFVASLVLACASVVSAQTVYEAAPQPQIYNPFYKNLNEQAVKRLWVLSQHWCVRPPGAASGMTPGEYYPATPDSGTFYKTEVHFTPDADEAASNVKPGPHAGEISVTPAKQHGKLTSVDTSANPANPAAKGEVIVKPYKR